MVGFLFGPISKLLDHHLLLELAQQHPAQLSNCLVAGAYILSKHAREMVKPMLLLKT